MIVVSIRPADLHSNSSVVQLLRMIKVGSVEIRQSVVDVSFKRMIWAIFQCENQPGDEIGCESNDQPLYNKIQHVLL